MKNLLIITILCLPILGNTYEPKFNKGDCIRKVIPSKFKEKPDTVFTWKVVNRNNRYYLLQMPGVDRSSIFYSLSFSERLIDTIDNSGYYTIDSALCEDD